MPWDQLEDLIIDSVGKLQSHETYARVKLEKPITKAIDVTEIYENMLNKNTIMLTKNEYTITYLRKPNLLNLWKPKRIPNINHNRTTQSTQVRTKWRMFYSSN